MGIFSDAKKTPSKASKSKPAEVLIAIEGLEMYGTIDAVIKSLTALKATYGEEAKDKMREHFIKVGAASASRPANFKGGEGLVSASCELRARSATSPLSEDEVALLKAYNIPMVTNDVVVDTYIINPAYATDQKLLGKIEKAMLKVSGLPEDFIMKQDGVATTVVAPNALDVLFSKAEKIVRECINLVGVLAIKPKLDADVAEAYETVGKMFQVEDVDMKKAA